jgi:hypothetical protein
MTDTLKEASFLSAGDLVVLTQGQYSSGGRTTDSMAVFEVP